MDRMRTILLVEDDPNDELLICRALDAGKIPGKLVVVRDGAEAIQYLHGSADDGESVPPRRPPEIVLLDLNLPKLGGLEVLRRIRADSRTHCLPVIVLTSSSEERDLVESYRLGANSYVQKPVDFGHFLETTGQLAWYWLVLNKLPAAYRDK